MKKRTIDEIKKETAKCGFILLSEVYLPNHSKLKFECKNGHKFEADPSQILSNRKRGCPHCFGNAKLTIDVCKKYAKLKNGKCLSNK